MSKVFFLTLLAGVAGALIADRKGRSWMFWGMVCAVFPFLIILILIIPSLIGRKSKAVLCPFCGKPTSSDGTVCGRCGRELPIELVRCPNCSKYVPLRDYCSECNKSLRDHS